jgi:ABC-type multidrug transport system fused ATPase/permease subunit
VSSKRIDSEYWFVRNTREETNNIARTNIRRIIAIIVVIDVVVVVVVIVIVTFVVVALVGISLRFVLLLLLLLFLTTTVIWQQLFEELFVRNQLPNVCQEYQNVNRTNNTTIVSIHSFSHSLARLKCIYTDADWRCISGRCQRRSHDELGTWRGAAVARRSDRAAKSSVVAVLLLLLLF